MPERTLRYPAMDLIPGDRYIHRDAEGGEHIVTVTEKLGVDTDRFGTRLIQFIGTADGRTGRILFGERASVEAVIA